MSVYLSIYSLFAILCSVPVGILAFIFSKNRNLQVLVIRHPVQGALHPTIRYKVFSTRYPAANFLLIIFIVYNVLIWIIGSTFDYFNFQATLLLALIVTFVLVFISCIIGWSLGILSSYKRNAQAQILAEAIYTSSGRKAEGDLHNLLIVVDEYSQQHARFLDQSTKERIKNYPILLS